MANVCGTKALDFFLECAGKMCMDLRVTASSCVPATALETSGAEITAKDIEIIAGHEKLCGLAEMMNYPGLLSGDRSVLEKLCLFYRRTDGHAPMLSGRDLNAYIAAGVINDHECISVEEGLEKLRKGMSIFIREGSVARNLNDLMPLITLQNADRLAFCTDDRNPLDIEESGHIDGMVAKALAAGCEPLAVFRTACLSPAIQKNIRGKGLLAPGYKADIILLSDFMKCKVHSVFCGGRHIDEKLFASRACEPSTAFCRNSVKRKKVTTEDFKIISDSTSTPVIGINELSLITEHLSLDMPPGEKKADAENDIAKIATLERHGKNGNIGMGFVRGFKMKKGALASTIGHDSHNICVVGMSDEDMACAVNALIDSQGGQAAVIDGKVVGLVPLPLAGLMSDLDHAAVATKLRELHKAAALTGTPLETPFLQLAFLPLPVIPFLRITDRGMFDVASWKFLD